MSLPRIAVNEGRVGFRWLAPAGQPTTLAGLVLLDEEPERLLPTHLEALDDVLIEAAGRFGEVLGGGRAPSVGAERAALAELQVCLDALITEYADAQAPGPVPLRAGMIIGTAALLATRARMALGTAGPFPFAGELDDPRIGVVAGRGQLQQVDVSAPGRGARWVVAAEDGRRYPLTLSMLLFDSSGTNKDAALDEHREALRQLSSLAGGLGSGDAVVLAGAIEWLLSDWLMAHRASVDSAAIELRAGREADAAMIVVAAAAGARLRLAAFGSFAGSMAGAGRRVSSG